MVWQLRSARMREPLAEQHVVGRRLAPMTCLFVLSQTGAWSGNET